MAEYHIFDSGASLFLVAVETGREEKRRRSCVRINESAREMEREKLDESRVLGGRNGEKDRALVKGVARVDFMRFTSRIN